MTNTAFNEELASYYKYFIVIALRLTRDRNNANDLMQETIMRAFLSRGRFTEGTNFKAWVYSIMRHCFLNEYRKIRTRSHVLHLIEDNMQVVMQVPAQSTGPSVVMMKELRNMVDDLGETNRVPFEMFVDGYCYFEIAEQLKLPIGTVKSRIFMARKRLKNVITQNYDAQTCYA